MSGRKHPSVIYKTHKRFRRTYENVYVHAYVRMHIFMHMHAYVCVYIYIHIRIWINHEKHNIQVFGARLVGGFQKIDAHVRTLEQSIHIFIYIYKHKYIHVNTHACMVLCLHK